MIEDLQDVIICGGIKFSLKEATCVDGNNFDVVYECVNYPIIPEFKCTVSKTYDQDLFPCLSYHIDNYMYEFFKCVMEPSRKMRSFGVMND